MLELIKAGGFAMWPLLLCSILAMAIIGERLVMLRRRRVVPAATVAAVRDWLSRGEVTPEQIRTLEQGSPLGQVLAAGLVNRRRSPAIMREAIEDAGRHAGIELERYLNALGIIATVAPFLGLFGTVLGMIRMFSGLGQAGVGDPAILASGIAQALTTTATGLGIAIPSLIFYRVFRGRVNDLLVDMEREAMRLVELIRGEREAY
ncbi:MAG: MotA/TolQ/ExbB proton channel family protein [Gammaproteobacteria bacterium]|nr:MotA/TolQ/ExbB proton channel family protein [Gammaproteobacteria bacterium]